MTQPELVDEFKKGLMALQSSYLNNAVVHLRKAVEHDGNNPFYLSYYGLALARAENDCATAEAFCLAALRLERHRAHLYLNLAEVYRRAGNLDDALSTLYNGLQFTQWDWRLVQAVEELGVRRPPVFPFLGRKHFLNRQLGKLRHRFEKPDRVSALESLHMGRS